MSASVAVAVRCTLYGQSGHLVDACLTDPRLIIVKSPQMAAKYWSYQPVAIWMVVISATEGGKSAAAAWLAAAGNYLLHHRL
jgi:hypothetical protein